MNIYQAIAWLFVIVPGMIFAYALFAGVGMVMELFTRCKVCRRLFRRSHFMHIVCRRCADQLEENHG